MDIRNLQEMWKKDSKIDIDNLHIDSIHIAELHAKYYEILNKIRLLKTKAEEDRKKLKHKKHRYVTGKLDDPDVEIPNIIYNKREASEAVDADDEISDLVMKIKYYEAEEEFLIDVIKMIHNRGYQIKNAIDYQKFISGVI